MCSWVRIMLQQERVVKIEELLKKKKHSKKIPYWYFPASK
jgi:hypothetical protein